MSVTLAHKLLSLVRDRPVLSALAALSVAAIWAGVVQVGASL
jgi:hypothetical protein